MGQHKLSAKEEENHNQKQIQQAETLEEQPQLNLVEPLVKRLTMKVKTTEPKQSLILQVFLHHIIKDRRHYNNHRYLPVQ